MAKPPRSGAVNPLSEPRRRPTGVRAPATMTEGLATMGRKPPDRPRCRTATIPSEDVPTGQEDLVITRIDHVGVAVADLDAAKAFYAETFGLVTVHEEVNEQQGVREAMLAASPGRRRTGRAAAAARPRRRRVDDREVPRPVRAGDAPPRLDRRRHRVDERRAAWPGACACSTTSRGGARPARGSTSSTPRTPAGSSSSSSSPRASGAGAASGRRGARTDRPRSWAAVRPPARRRRGRLRRAPGGRTARRPTGAAPRPRR